VTSKKSLRFNFVVLTLFLGTAIMLLLIFGVTQLMWYVANGEPIIGYALWMVSFVIAAGCVYADYVYARKLKNKLKEMVS
jgi:peptidoglycan biosynthesis protein MviN/MurJ (putative lipid II flippase)